MTRVLENKLNLSWGYWTPEMSEKGSAYPGCSGNIEPLDVVILPGKPKLPSWPPKIDKLVAGVSLMADVEILYVK